MTALPVVASITPPREEPPSGGFFVGKSVHSGNWFSIAGEGLDEHEVVQGKPRSGKSNYIEWRFLQNALMPPSFAGATAIIIDEQLFEAVTGKLAKYRMYKERPVYILDVGSDEHTPAIDGLYVPPGASHGVVATGFASMVAQIWGEDSHATPLTRAVLQHTAVALIELELPLSACGALLWDVEGPVVRKRLVERIRNKDTKAFFVALEQMPAVKRIEYLGSAARRLQEFLSSPYTKRAFSMRGGLDLAQAMDDGALIILKAVPDGIKFSHDDARLIAALYLNQLYAACFRRQKRHVRHFAYCDECGSYLTDAVAHGLDRARKYGLRYVLGFHTFAQLHKAGPEVYGAVMGDPGIRTIFGGLSIEDAKINAELLGRGYFDLARKKKSTRPVAVGVELVELRGRSHSSSITEQTGSNWSFGTSRSTNEQKSESVQETASRADTTSQSVARSHSHTNTHGGSTVITDTENWSSTDSETEQEGASEGWDYDRDELSPFGVASGYHEGNSSGSSRTASKTTGGSRSVAEGTNWSVADTEGRTDTEGTATTLGTAIARGTTIAKGVSEGTNSSHGGSTSRGSSTGQSESVAEAFKTIYAELATDNYTLDELIHLMAVSIANTPPGVCHIRVLRSRPRRVKTPYLGNELIYEPGRLRVASLLASRTPCNTPVSEVLEQMATRERFFATLARSTRKAAASKEESEEEQDDAWVALAPPKAAP